MLNEDYDQLLGIRQTKTVNQNILKFKLLIAHNYTSEKPINTIILTGSIRNNDLIELLLETVRKIHRHKWIDEPGENNKSIYSLEGTDKDIVQWHYIRPGDFIPDVTTCTLRNLIPIHDMNDYNELPKYANNFNEFVDFTDFQIYNSDEQGVDLEYNIDKYNTWDTYHRLSEIQDHLNDTINIINPYYTYFRELTWQLMGIEAHDERLINDLENLLNQRLALFETYCKFHADKLVKVESYQNQEFYIPPASLLSQYIDEIDQSLPQYNEKVIEAFYVYEPSKGLPQYNKLLYLPNMIDYNSKKENVYNVDDHFIYNAIEYLTNLKIKSITKNDTDDKPLFDPNINWNEILQK
ncbi:hypothetical protein [Methanosphaera cuniculi]|uniref:Uncharacterized protein n=1 Tax=Methanosphaera cuniculi TaxID=1077256 RepID=A0A2A2HDQ1_9EURY|nr:hypothetical protein [Methanosphaera cuniculi]PAV07527.1 hypothetical protein ASJ82_07575 [Methanosphaera cuniculi]PWL08157.1 hypothetical protein MSCUN_10880 [Methanosphaera cuniculi]